MDPLFWQIPLLAGVGLVAGILNVLAGGGSLLTLPVLIFIGLPAATANGTNRIAIFCQNIFAIAACSYLYAPGAGRQLLRRNPRHQH